ncbi:hypothetical protein Tsp_05589 [Trichinella spiralis]|uniref:hypothetical protein n=1 Tax=Trichinella spiralis TaxID=6334 RepID=UPI0001EFDF9B|nr:hypothetical protein Tsp_05589 [Trichinella spiralis]
MYVAFRIRALFAQKWVADCAVGFALVVGLVSVVCRRIDRQLCIFESIFCNCTRSGCGISDHGPERFICETRGGCMRSLKMTESGDIEEHYDCVIAEHWYPPERPLGCYVNRYFQHLNAIGCCRDESFCASKLNVSFSPKWEEDPPDESESTSTEEKDSIEIWPVLVYVMSSICILASCVFVVFTIQLHIRRRRRAKQDYTREL